ncbi:MAG: PP2C family protein-serine/threonine phosphatase [Bacteroidota bacterium]|jgi:serine/threonine protein phosphatase PrpC
MITIKKENYFSELGGQSLNEDSFAYIPGNIYLVADGGGGAGKGDVASKMAVKCFVESFRADSSSTIQSVLQQVEGMLTQYISENPDAEGMFTSLSIAQIKNVGIEVSWVGNSKVFQFRNCNLIFQTSDHSWVNEALKTGLITPEEAINHPKSNTITRLIQGSHKSTKADSVLLTDVARSDIFLICTSGVAEVWAQGEIENIFKSGADIDDIRSQIVSRCTQRLSDNFSGVIFQVHDARIPLKESVAILTNNNDTVADDQEPGNPDVNISDNNISSDNDSTTKTDAKEELFSEISSGKDVVVGEEKNFNSPENKNVATNNDIEFITEEKPNADNNSIPGPGFSINYKRIIGYSVLVLFIGILIWKWPSASSDKQINNSDTLNISRTVVKRDSIQIRDSLKNDSINKLAQKKIAEQKKKAQQDSINKITAKPQKKGNKNNWRYNKRKKKTSKKFKKKKKSTTTQPVENSPAP